MNITRALTYCLPFIQECHNKSDHNNSDAQMTDTQMQNSDILMWVQITLVSTVGTLVSLALIHFEKWGGDPQKRSMGNRLVSHLLAINLAQCWLRSSFIVFARYFLCPVWVLVHSFSGVSHFLPPSLYRKNL